MNQLAKENIRITVFLKFWQRIQTNRPKKDVFDSVAFVIFQRNELISSLEFKASIIISEYRGMIKQSFLRNYSLRKIYNQAEDEKNKLKVFYLRQVNKILKEKQKKERIVNKEKISKENRQVRVQERQKTRMKTHLSTIKTEPNQSEETQKEENMSELRYKYKTELKIIQLELLERQNRHLDYLMSNERLRNILKQSLKNRSFINDFNKISNLMSEQNQRECIRKNTLKKPCTSRNLNNSQNIDGCCKNQSIAVNNHLQGELRYSKPYLQKESEKNSLKNI